MDDETYWGIGNFVGGLAAVITFVGSWWFCAATYGFLFGFGLGWLPSLILSAIVFFCLKLLWPLVVLAVAAICFLIFKEPQTSPAPLPEPTAEYSPPQAVTTSEWSDVRQISETNGKTESQSPQRRQLDDDATRAAKDAARLATDAALAAASEAASANVSPQELREADQH